ncbi:MAG TPA: sugar ABC transporter permease [Rectinema sp.]|nr:sugar ABC transporter permease [Rectinema sp.]
MRNQNKIQIRNVRRRQFADYSFSDRFFYPIIGSFYLGFTDWDLLRTPKFIGLSNFIEALSDPGLIRIVVNTVLFSVIYVIGVMVIGLFLALMVNQKLPGTNFFRAAYYLPVITSAVAIGIIWSWILSPQVGILNILVKSVGLKPPNWLGDTHWALLTVSVIQVWKMAGYYMVLFLAGLQSIPDSVKEAAVVDGANSLQLFFHVTLPMLSPTTFFVLTVAMIDSFKNFELIYTMTRGGPQSSTTTLVYDVYVYGFVHYRMGYASAVAYVLMVLVGAITIANFYIKKRWVTNSYY